MHNVYLFLLFLLNSSLNLFDVNVLLSIVGQTWNKNNSYLYILWHYERFFMNKCFNFDKKLSTFQPLYRTCSSLKYPFFSFKPTNYYSYKTIHISSCYLFSCVTRILASLISPVRCIPLIDKYLNTPIYMDLFHILFI